MVGGSDLTSSTTKLLDLKLRLLKSGPDREAGCLRPRGPASDFQQRCSEVWEAGMRRSRVSALLPRALW